MNNAAKSFDILATSLNILHNHFDGLTKLFSDLYLSLGALAKSFFPWIATKNFRVLNLEIQKYMWIFGEYFKVKYLYENDCKFVRAC